MPKAPPDYQPYIESDNACPGFSAIALNFWRAGEKLRNEAEKQTAGQKWRTHWSNHSAICLYHAALECFINEEITLFTARLEPKQEKEKVRTEAYRIQGDTLNRKKIDNFWSLFGLADKVTPAITRRTGLLTELRNCLYHHWPLLRDVRDYPAPVIAALTDAQIERINTSWAGQCSDIRLGEWAAKATRGFVDEWWRLGRPPAEIERLHWEYGPDWRQPPETAPPSTSQS